MDPNIRQQPSDPGSQESRALERDRIRFERQKLALELRFRRRELSKDKNKGILREAVGNPITLAIVGGILTLLTTTVSNHLTSRENLETEKQKAILAERSARETLQADLIKKFVENGKVEVVRENLRFLVDSGLIPTYASSIETYLKTNPVSAPRIGSGVAFLPEGEAVDDLIRNRIQEGVAHFRSYLKGLGFRGLDQDVSIFVFSSERPPPNGSATLNAFYADDTIFIHKSLTLDSTIALREYTHHALFAMLGPRGLRENHVESALADYLPASFLNSPVIGSGLGKLFGLPTDYIRRLDVDVQYDEGARDGAWGAALWACRQNVGQALFDDALLPAWTAAMSPPETDHATADKFGKALSAVAGGVGPCFSQEIARRHLR